MDINKYDSFQNSLRQIAEQQLKIADIVSKNLCSLDVTLKPITTALSSFLNSPEYQQLITTTSRLTETFSKNIAPQLKTLTDNTYKILLNYDFSVLRNLQNTLNHFDTLNIDSLDVNDNGDITYENETFKSDEIQKNTSELLAKAATGTLDYTDIKHHPVLTISLALIFYIIFNLIIPDIYSSAKQYIKDNYFSAVNEIQDVDYHDFRIITTDILNVRRNPATDADIIGKLYYLNVVKVIDSCPYWLKIEYADTTNNIQITGWISKKYSTDFSQESEKILKLNNK